MKKPRAAALGFSFSCSSEQQLIEHLHEQQAQHQKHHAADLLAAAADGVERAEIIAGDAARESGDRQRPKHLPVQDPHHSGGGAGGQVARLGAASRGDEVEREQRREAEDHKGTGARADQPVVAAEHQSDEGGAQQLLPRRINGTLLGGDVPPEVLFDAQKDSHAGQREFEDAFDYEETDDQLRAIAEIKSDMERSRPMDRLLCGDVGYGKTEVALRAVMKCVLDGKQAAILVPTTVLAQQHYVTAINRFRSFPVTIEVLSRFKTPAQKKKILQSAAEGKIDLLIGTHALIEDRVQFSNLGFVVIDEQHRFGVEQRARLWTKNLQPPHILVMTATPIPRTLAMTLYGDLDVSVIDELPPGRRPIKTFHYTDAARLKLFGFMRQEIAKGRQVYVVYPLIKESEAMDYKDLTDGYEAISRDFPLPQYVTAICHGKMKPADKEESMRQFKQGEAHILVATSVIEVGVDVPNATVMVIESAERFGLSQLHQLRGRVGRGGEQSYCILMSGEKLSRESRARLEAMCETNDGFRLAELDLKLRGAGDINGTLQSGMAFDLKIASPTADVQILTVSREAAAEILAADPALAHPQNRGLEALRRRYSGREEIDFSRIS